MNLWWEMDIIFIFISQHNNRKLKGIIVYLEVVFWCCKFWNSSRNVYSTVEIELRCPSAITSVLLSFVGCLNIYQGKDHGVEALLIQLVFLNLEYRELKVAHPLIAPLFHWEFGFNYALQSYVYCISFSVFSCLLFQK